MPEIISLHIGQAGIQLSSAIWELYCTEHSLQTDGRLKFQESDNDEINDITTFFSISDNNQYNPRSVIIDSEPRVIDEIRTGSYKNLFHPAMLISGKEDAASNFARGHFTIGRQILQKSMEQVRKLVSNCDMLHGFIITSAYGGGTGSGFQTLLLEHLNIEFSKNLKMALVVYPSSTLSTSPVEPYNSILTNYSTIDQTELCIPFDNKSTFNICQKFLEMNQPTYSSINRLIAHITSSMTVSLRHKSSLNSDLGQIATNLVPYPRIHFPVLNASPILSEARASHETLTATDMTKMLFHSLNQTTDINIKEGMYFCCSLQYRGYITPREINSSIIEVKKLHDIHFVDWCPTGFKIGINCQPPVCIPLSKIAQSDMNVTMLSNTSSIVQMFEKIDKNYETLFKKRCFLHWFIGEGMEEAEFSEAKDMMNGLIKDYKDIEIRPGGGTVELKSKPIEKVEDFQTQLFIKGNNPSVRISINIDQQKKISVENPIKTPEITEIPETLLPVNDKIKPPLIKNESSIKNSPSSSN